MIVFAEKIQKYLFTLVRQHSVLMSVFVAVILLYLFGDFQAESLLAVPFALGGGGGGDGGGTDGFSVDENGNPIGGIVGDSTDSPSPGPGIESSTPFLKLWNGKAFVFENDFLFGKPNTAFADEATARAAYQAGIGGDTYILQSPLGVTADNTYKMQIHEIEPEESFIDTFTFHALDIADHEHAIVDTSLDTLHVFDTKKVVIPEEQTLYQYHINRTEFTPVQTTSRTLTETDNSDLTLETGDELVLKLPQDLNSQGHDAWLMVDSHFRDWTLGNEIPFTTLEKFQIQTQALAQAIPSLAVGTLMFGIGALGAGAAQQADMAKLTELFKTERAYADNPPPPPPPGPGDKGGGGGSGGRSLLVFAQVGNDSEHLATIFPRYLTSTQELVRIPKEWLEKAKDGYLTLRIRATKKHKVRSAFFFFGTPRDGKAAAQPLTLTTATHRRDGADYSQLLTEKNGEFLHTQPGDVVDVEFAAAPAKPGMNRLFLLTASGFYTPMSAATKATLGTTWFTKLDRESRKLLTRLKRRSV